MLDTPRTWEMETDEGNRIGSRQKRIASNTRVSGEFGEFIEDSTDGKRRKRARIYGTVIEAVDTKRCKALFDNGSYLDCYSNSLRVEYLDQLFCICKHQIVF